MRPEEAESVVNTDADVIVVGCGVAGATAAKTAAALGSRVMVLEDHPHVGIPSHCSGHVGIKTMQRLGVQIHDKIIKNRIRGAVFHAPSGQVIRLERRVPVTWVLDRQAFDEYLSASAQKSGAEIKLNHRALSMKRSGSEQVQVRVSVGDSVKTVSAKLVIDCEGVAPTLVPREFKGPTRKTMWVNSAQVHADDVRDLDDDLVHVYLGSTYAPGFFAWIIPWRNGSAKVGLATRRGNARLLLEEFMTRHPDASPRLRGTILRGASYHPIPLNGPVSRSYYPSMLVAGDAAQQVKPTTGGGIILSLICGKAAGEVASEASRRDDISESFLSAYERRWKSEIGADLNAMRRIRRMLFRLPDRSLDRIFSFARSVGVAEVLGRADDIDMQGRTLAKLAVDPRLAVSMLYSAVLSLPFLAEQQHDGRE